MSTNANAPRRFLLGDEGNSALHYVDLDAPAQNWTYRGPGRDLQLVGKGRVLRSQPTGYIELDLRSRGAELRNVTVSDVPGGIETARRLPSGHTVVMGNANDGSGIFAWEVDEQGRAAQKALYPGIEKARMLRHTAEGTFLFCSETAGKSRVHEATWSDGATTVYEAPEHVPTDSMVKAVRISASEITVSTGYAASLIVVNTERSEVQRTVGGKSQSEPSFLERPLSPFFFSGYQMLEDGKFLISNWQGHSSEKNGQGYQVLLYSNAGALLWAFDQTAFPHMSSLNNVIALDHLDVEKLHDEPRGVLVPLT